MTSPARLSAALALAMLALAALCATPAAARRSSAACTARAHRHALHPRSCIRSHRHGSRRSGLAVRRARTRAGTPRAGAGASAGILLRSAPVCEDGRSAVRDRAGVLACGDGSAPACGEGRTPTDSSEGHVLYCTASPPPAGKGEACDGEDCEPADGGEGSSATPCREGSPASLEEDSFSCPDGGEPSCPEGTTLTLTGDETELVCEPATADGEQRS